MEQIEHVKLNIIQKLEIQMMVDMYNRLTDVCHKKCIPAVYAHDAEIATGEAVCIDRCVTKFLDIHERIGKRLKEIANEDEDLFKQT